MLDLDADPPVALAIVELVPYACVTRWHFRLQDADRLTVHTGEPRILKLEAMADRKAMQERAGAWRRRVQDGYADPDDAEAPLLRVMLRALYSTRDCPRAPGG